MFSIGLWLRSDFREVWSIVLALGLKLGFNCLKEKNPNQLVVTKAYCRTITCAGYIMFCFLFSLHMFDMFHCSLQTHSVWNTYVTSLMMMSVAWMTLHWRELDIEYVVSELSDLLKKIYPGGWQERREVFKGGVGKACHVNQCGVAPRGVFPRARSKEQKYWSRRWPINPSHPVTNVWHPLAKRAGESFALSYTQRRHSPSAPQRHCKFSRYGHW